MSERSATAFSSDSVRATALASAIAARDHSLRTDESYPTRRSYRTLMRERAIAWRQPAREMARVHKSV